MHINEYIECNDFTCSDIEHKCYLVPNIDIQPENVLIIIISEAASAERASGNGFTGRSKLFSTFDITETESRELMFRDFVPTHANFYPNADAKW